MVARAFFTSRLGLGDAISGIAGVAKSVKANLSQHLSVLRQKGIVLTRREGTNIYYRIAYPKITEACSVMRGVLVESLRAQETLAKQIMASGEQR